MRVSYLVSLLVFGTIGALAVAGCGGSGGNVEQGAAPAAAEAAADPSASEALGYISSAKAGEHMGEEGTVRGNVKDYQFIIGDPKAYILLFDVAGTVQRGSSASSYLETPETFTVVIWKEDHKNFPSNFAAGYNGKTVCVTGMIVDYDGSPAIEAHDPSQLEIDC